MKLNKQIIFILIVFFKTGTVLSENNLFNVNNIQLEKKDKSTNNALANLAIKKGFNQLIAKILLKKDSDKLSDLSLSSIKRLVTYYQISNTSDEKKNVNNNVEKINFNISFDKDKIHNLFYRKGISYSKITNKELFILPILKQNNKIYIYSQNFFYDKWNETNDEELIEFILPLENIETIQNVNLNRNNLLNLKLKNIFIEYEDKNLALILIEDNNFKEEKIYIKAKILGKNIVKNINIKRLNLNKDKFYKKIITEVKQEIIYLIKSQNLIDIRAPSFLNAELKINKKSNLVVLNSRLKNINLIENIYVQELNNESIFLKIKYLGKLDEIIRQLEIHKIILKLNANQWSIKII